jgi:hypothetical protein
MADFPLLLEAPSREWAEHLQTLIQDALGERGSVHLGLPGESLTGAPAGYTVTGIAVCNEPEEEMLTLITSKLVDFDVRTQPLSGQTQIIIAPPEP